MRYSLFALAAASTALASPHMHRRGHGAHANVFARSAVAPAAEDCVCSTYVTSRVYAVTVPVAVPTGSVAVPNYEGSSSGVPEDSVVTVVPVYESDADATTTIPVSEVAYETSISYVDSPSSVPVAVPEVPAPTPAYSTFTEPGTYTIPATTITISETEVVCNAEQTTLTAGDNTYGGITTVVPAPTTMTVPYATVEVEDETTTSKIVETVYVCPTPGTYTVAPTTSHVDEDTPVTYVVPTTIVPGTYTAPEQTVTITKTSQVVVCPYETIAPEVSSAVSEVSSSAAPVVSEVPEVSSSAAPVVSEVPEVSSSAAPVVTETPKPVETPKVETYVPKTVEVEEESSDDAEEVVPETVKAVTSNEGLWSISYSPYEDNQDCRSAEGVASDIADIASKGFKNVRVYGTECNTLENVGAACKASGLKMIVGVFIEGDLSSGDSQIKDIVAWKQWDLVEVIVIGNEAIFNGYTDAPGLAAYINKNKALIQGAGYTGQFTTTDTLGAFQGDGVASALCSCLDILGVNIQVFFDGGRSASEAGEFFASQVSDAKKICPGKEVYILEAGWPSAGDSNGNAITGKAEQKLAIEGMKAAAPGHISFFTYKNDLWKASPDHIEANFGCGDLF